MRAKAQVAVLIAILTAAGFAAAVFGQEEPQILKVGHVGHDHQMALYVAAEAGQFLEGEYGVYLKEIKPREVYDLYDGGRAVARVHLVKVGGGARMPASMSVGDIEVGLGGLGPVVEFIDKGVPLKVLAPLNIDGDALVVRKGIPASSWQEFVSYVKGSERPVRVGYKDPMAVAYMILKRALDEEGIRHGPEPADENGKPVQVITVDLHGLENALPSIETKTVDAVVVNEPMAATLVVRGAGARAADLGDLPPYGKWKGHPCCVVAATEKALAEKRPAIVSLLKVIAAGGDLMARDTGRALEAAAAWTETPPEIGRESIPNVSYVIKPDEAWLGGVDTWLDLMGGSGHFKNRLKGMSVDKAREGVLELGPINEALAGLKL